MKVQYRFRPPAVAVAASLTVALLATLSSGLCSAQVLFDGLVQFPLGASTVTPDSVTNVLRIANLGSSGLDGVAVNLTGNQGFHVDAVIDAPTEVHGRFAQVDTASGVDQELVGFDSQQQTDGTYSHLVDFSAVGATTSRREYFLDGTLLFTEDLVPNDQPLRTKVYPLGNDFYYVDSCCPGEFDHISLSGVTLVYFTKKAQGDSLTVDRVDIYPEDPVTDFGAPNVFELTVAGPPSFDIVAEKVEEFGHLHRAFGDVTYVDTGGGDLTFAAADSGNSNHNSTRSNGGSIYVGKVEGGEILWDELDSLSTTPDSTLLHFAATGRFGGLDDQPLGWQEFMNNGNGALDITADLSAIGSATQTIQVFDGGTLAFEATGHSGPVGTVASWPGGCGKLGGQTPCLWSGWSFPVAFEIDGSVIVGDELRILAEGASSAIEHISEFTVAGGGFGPMRITSETMTPLNPLSAVPDEREEFSGTPRIVLWHGSAPNPFNPQTELSFSLRQATVVNLRIYDQRGLLVRTLVSTELGAGYHQVTWDGRNDQGSSVASGLYLSMLEAGTDLVRDKLMLVK